MNLNHLTDQQLALDIKNICQKERALLTQVLYHLKEIESRKLYSSFGYSSLFDYACNELKYSSDQAYRRIQAMRLLKDIPEVVSKIDSGELSLSNITQAQKFFKDTKVLNQETLNTSEKINVLKKLMNKSVRDGQKELLKLSPNTPLPLDTKKQVTPTHTYVRFTMSEDLEKKLENIKSLLGPKAYNLNVSDLINLMADLAKEKLEEKKFGKRLSTRSYDLSSSLINHRKSEDTINHETKSNPSTLNIQSKQIKKPTLQAPSELSKNSILNKSNDVKISNCQIMKIDMDQTSVIKVNSRYVSKRLKYKVWHKNKSKCCNCNTHFNLQLDHVKPFAFDGETSEENLRLLCFSCNQRKRIEAGL